MKQENVTISMVAKRAGVSKTTISRYLNGKYEFMSSETKQKIEEIIQELNYRPNTQARSLKSKKSQLIGVMIADIGNLFSSYILKGMNTVCRENGYQLLIMNADNSAEIERVGITQMLDQHIEGILLQEADMRHSAIEYLDKNEITTVLFDREETELRHHTVTSNNYEAGYQMTKKMIAAGYEQIVFCTEEIDGITTRRLRCDAVKAACEEANCNFELLEVSDFSDWQEWGERAQQLITTKRTALFAANDGILFEVLKFANQNNIKIKEDMGLSGFDDLGWGELVPPGISTIQQNPYEMGKVSAELLIQQIQEATTPEKCTLESELIIRASF